MRRSSPGRPFTRHHWHFNRRKKAGRLTPDARSCKLTSSSAGGHICRREIKSKVDCRIQKRRHAQHERNVALRIKKLHAPMIVFSCIEAEVTRANVQPQSQPSPASCRSTNRRQPTGTWNTLASKSGTTPSALPSFCSVCLVDPMSVFVPSPNL